MVISEGPFELAVQVLSGKARDRNLWRCKLSYYGLECVSAIGYELESTAKLAFVLFDRLYCPAVLNHVQYIREEMRRSVRTCKGQHYDDRLAEVFRRSFGVAVPDAAPSSGEPGEGVKDGI